MLPNTLLALVLSILAPASASSHDEELCPILDDQTPMSDACARNITILKPGSSLLAKLQCIGCPTVWVAPYNASSQERLRVVNYTEDNYLILNVTVKANKKSLLLNNREIIPVATIPPPDIYAPQVAANWTVADLVRTIYCEEHMEHHYKSYGECVENTVGAMHLDYALSWPARPKPVAETTKKLAWQIKFDVFGGRDGFMDDPYVVLDSMAQGQLVVAVEESIPSGDLRILGAAIRARNRKPHYLEEMTWLEKAYFFLGLRDDPDVQTGRVVYVNEHWDDDGRVGTRSWCWRRVWNNSTTWIVLIVLSSVTGGLMSLFALYRVLRLVASLPPKEVEKGDEHERLLGEDGRERLLAGDGGDEEEQKILLDYKSLPDKPLPEIPHEEDASSCGGLA